MPERKRQNERLIVMLVIGIIALNYPILSLFSKMRLMFGIPVLYLYLFTFWAVFILCLALVMEKKATTTLVAQPKKQDQEKFD